MTLQMLPQPDVLIAGGGIIGLALALELEKRGADVAVLDTQRSFRQTSFAAAGMLAAKDPHNPAELGPLAELSVALYPGFLARIAKLSGSTVPFQTDTTFQHVGGEKRRLAEDSLDPRQLAEALLRATRSTSIDLRENTGEVEVLGDMRVRTGSGLEFQPRAIVHASGAWFRGPGAIGQGFIVPRKGQMMRVQMPRALALEAVHRSEQIYIVPRRYGPQAGTTLLGATVEDAGFDIAVHENDLAHLRRLAADLVPALADAKETPMVEAWAGIRPATRDGLPILGVHPEHRHQWIATGHFRNGILLAPATARVMADLVEGKTSAVDLTSFTPQRFAAGE